MLDKVIMLPVIIFCVLLVIFMGVIATIMHGQWCMVQNQAQFVASTMGKWGGYTDLADDSLDEFARELNCPRHRIDVDVSNVYPVPWGRTVWAEITVPFEFRLGEYHVGTYELTGMGRSVSTYLEGAYSGVRYVYP